VVFRDVLIIGGFMLSMTVAEPQAWRPLTVSKINTTLQILLIVTVLGHLGLGVDDHGLTRLLIDAVAATTVLSGALYLIRWMRSFASAEEPRS